MNNSVKGLLLVIRIFETTLPLTKPKPTRTFKRVGFLCLYFKGNKLFMLTKDIRHVIIVANATVAYATIAKGVIMATIMRSVNVLSRCEAIWRTEKLGIEEIGGNHHSFILAICANPGKPQEWLAKSLSLNKSTVTRTLCYLEEKGYVKRNPDETDKRVLLIYPTEKMLEILPRVKEITQKWNALITEEISEDELLLFRSVLEKIREKAKAIIYSGEDGEKTK